MEHILPRPKQNERSMGLEIEDCDLRPLHEWNLQITKPKRQNWAVVNDVQTRHAGDETRRSATVCVKHRQFVIIYDSDYLNKTNYVHCMMLH